MRESILSSLAVLLVAPTAGAATLYVAPAGSATSGCTTREAACSLAAAASSAVAGDTVVLLDGVYKEQLYVANSGTSGAWITFEADECATPIIEGQGVGPNDDNQDTGVGSAEAEYVRFRGLVSRGWNTGFGNGWVGGTDTEDVSNGHWEIENCAAYSNGRTGFTFYSAEGFHVAGSIAAHNGSSVLHSWSSGITLFEAAGSANGVESTVSFENTDAERHTDGSGFIVDEESNGTTFVNNIAFGNGGSCFRLTRSSGTRFINNTCYHDSQFGSQATGPTNPGEVYFTTGDSTTEGVTFMNNVFVGTGQSPAGSEPIFNQPPSGWTNNVVTTGSVTFFTDAAGTNPNFVPTGGATELIGAGSSSGAPTNDIGFDPKCIVKRTPVMVGSVARESWWQYDVDIDYIKSIGGVAKCFNPATRSGTPDIGAYKAGTVTTATPGNCTPYVYVPVSTGGAGGTAGSGGTGGTGTGGGTAGGTGGTTGTGGAGGVGGRTSTGGVGGNGGRTGTGGVGGTSVSTTGGGGTSATNTGGTVGVGGTGTGGTGPAVGGSGTGVGGVAAGGGGTANTGGALGTGATSTGSTGLTTGTGGGAGLGGSVGPGQSGAAARNDGGCGCRLAPAADHRGLLAALGVLGMGLLARRRRP